MLLLFLRYISGRGREAGTGIQRSSKHFKTKGDKQVDRQVLWYGGSVRVVYRCLMT